MVNESIEFDNFNLIGTDDACTYHHNIKQSFAKVNKKYTNTRLYLIGKGPLKKDLKSLIKQYKLESSVVMKDWVDNIYDYFKSADAYVLSSNYEGDKNKR